MKLALVHDWLNQVGGAEDVLEALVGSFPDSPIYTSIYAPEKLPAQYRSWDIRKLWIDKLRQYTSATSISCPSIPWPGVSCAFPALTSS